MKRLWFVVICALVLVLAACAPRTLSLEVPTYQVEGVRFARLDLPGPGSPALAVLNLNLRVQNPNALGLRMANIGGQLFLDGAAVGQVDLPDVDLPARGEARQLAVVSVPISFANLGEFVKVARGDRVALRVDGSFTVNAGFLGRPVFGPFTLFQGLIQNRQLVK